MVFSFHTPSVGKGEESHFSSRNYTGGKQGVWIPHHQGIFNVHPYEVIVQQAR